MRTIEPVELSRMAISSGEEIEGHVPGPFNLPRPAEAYPCGCVWCPSWIEPDTNTFYAGYFAIRCNGENCEV